MITPKFETANNFYENLASIKVDGLFGYIDTKGKLVIEPQFAAAEVFSEGLAAIIPESKEEEMGIYFPD